MSTNGHRPGDLKARLVKAVSLLESAQIQDVVLRYRDDLRRALRSAEAVSQADNPAKKVLICLRCCVDHTETMPDLDWVGDAFNTAYCDLQTALGPDHDWRHQLSLIPLTELPDSLVDAGHTILDKLAKELTSEGVTVDVDQGTRRKLSCAGIDRSGATSPKPLSEHILNTLSQRVPASTATLSGGLWGDIGIDVTFKHPSQKVLAAELVEGIHRILSGSDALGDDADSKHA